jgi:hypothetical protein
MAARPAPPPPQFYYPNVCRTLQIIRLFKIYHFLHPSTTFSIWVTKLPQRHVLEHSPPYTTTGENYNFECLNLHGSGSIWEDRVQNCSYINMGTGVNYLYGTLCL